MSKKKGGKKEKKRTQQIAKYLAANPTAALNILRTDTELAASSIRNMLQLDAAARAPQRESAAYPVLGPFGGISTSQPLQQTLPKQTPTNIRRFTEIPPARRAMCAIMDPVIDLPWTIELRKPIGNRAHQTQQEPNAEEQHRIEDVTTMLTAPNNDMSWRTFIRMVLEDLLTFGAGPFEIQENQSDERPFFMWPVDAQSIRVNAGWREGSDTARYSQGRGYYYGSLGTPDLIKFHDDELCYMKLNPRASTPFGFGYAEVAFGTINSFIGAFDYAERRASNNTPNFGIFLGENTTVEQARQWQHYWINEIEGNGKVPILGGGKQPSVFAMMGTGEDQLFIRWQEFCIRIIAMSFGVSPFRLGMERDVNRCYSDDTEVLTIDGWKTHDMLTENDFIAVVDKYSKEIAYQKPKSIYRYAYHGNMISMKNSLTDVLVTPNHRMYIGRIGSYTDYLRMEFVEASELQTITPQFYELKTVAGVSPDSANKDLDYVVIPGVPVAGSPGHKDRPGFTMDADTFLQFLGYFIAEGCAYVSEKTVGVFRTQLYQKAGPLADKIRYVLDQFPFQWEEKIDKRGDVILWKKQHKPLTTYLLHECGKGAADKRIPAWVKLLPERQLRIIFDALMEGDGTWRKREGWEHGFYTTASKQLADDVQEIAFKLGYRTQIAIHKNTHAKAHHLPLYRVVLSRRPYAMYYAKNVQEVSYSGTVWCVEVPPHGLFVTRRNGKISIHGNSTADASQDNDWMTVAPVANVIRDYLTYWLLWKRLGYKDLEFVWQIKTADELKQAEILAEQYNMNAITVDEIRLHYERPPLDDGQGDLTKTAYEAAIKASLEPQTLPGSSGGPNAEETPPAKPMGTPFDGEWSLGQVSPAEREFLKALKRAKRHERYGIGAVAT